MKNKPRQCPGCNAWCGPNTDKCCNSKIDTETNCWIESKGGAGYDGNRPIEYKKEGGKTFFRYSNNG